MRGALAIAAAVGLLALAGPAAAFTCPVAIQQAEDLVRKAEPRATPDTRPLLEEARRYLTEARAHHEQARTKRDHGDAVRKAKFAQALAEEVLMLAGP
ncbi:MAG TPA: hypothetical protein VNO23_05070 [Candidatus Binatia bacterium]|nr:hypothetical protein [Candidatus Binatia bacterium]